MKTPDVPRPTWRTQVGASVGAFDDGVLAGIVEDWALGKRNVCRDASDWYSERRILKKKHPTTLSYELWVEMRQKNKTETIRCIKMDIKSDLSLNLFYCEKEPNHLFRASHI